MAGMRIAAVCVISVLIPAAAWALDWKRLNEYADSVELETAARAAADDPASLEKTYIAAAAYLKVYRNAEAQDLFQRMLRQSPELREARWGIAECRRRSYHFEESRGILETIVAQDPPFAPAFVTLAYIRYLQMGFEDAARLCYKVITRGRKNVDLPTYVRAYCLYAGAKGMIAHHGGLISKIVNGSAVLHNLRMAESLQPDSPAVYFGLGSYHLLAPPALGRDPDLAIRYLEKAREHASFFADIYARLAQAYKLKGDIAKYDENIERALELDPRNIVALDIKNGTCKFICVGGGGK